MQVYILDVPSKSLKKMLDWLAAKREISAVEVFADYNQYLEKIKRTPPDLCLIRLGIASIPGIKTAGIVQIISPKTRIVFIADDTAYAVDAYEIGVYGYLLCPVEKEKLEKILAKVG